MKLKILEKDVLKSCLEYLAYRPGFYWRNNTGALPFGENRFIRFGLKGSADILGLRKLGDGLCQFIAIECKGTGGKQSKDQLLFQRNIESECGTYILAYSIDDLRSRGI